MDDVVVRAQRGDAAALEELLGSVAPTVLRFARRMCKSDADADDVLQDTLLAAATHLGEFEGRSSLSSWLFALARSACARKRRGLANRPAEDAAVLVTQADTGPSPESQVETIELAAALERALARMPDDYREVLLLRDVEGLTAPEAADAIGIGVDALKSRLHRARGALRDALVASMEPSVPAPQGCPDVVQALSQKLEGELTPADCARMESHLAGCPSCRAACNALEGALASCRRAKDATISPEIRSRLERALDSVRVQLDARSPKRAQKRG